MAAETADGRAKPAAQVMGLRKNGTFGVAPEETDPVGMLIFSPREAMACPTEGVPADIRPDLVR